MASTPARTSPGAADSLATVHAASALIGRVVPGRAGEFRLALIPADSGRDVFEVAAAGDTVILRGSSGSPSPPRSTGTSSTPPVSTSPLRSSR